MNASSLHDNYAGVFDHRVGFGTRPALIIVDFVQAYTAPESPFYAPDVAAAVLDTAGLLRAAREAAVPVIFTVVRIHPTGLDAGVWARKIPLIRELFAGGASGEIVPELDRAPADLVISKCYASAFFGTSLAATLTAAHIDTLILTGCSTSGCIRATAVDGLQHGFRVIVPRSCVADRHAAPHEANLFDIDAKYGDVVATRDVMSYLEGIARTAAGAGQPAADRDDAN